MHAMCAQKNKGLVEIHMRGSVSGDKGCEKMFKALEGMTPDSKLEVLDVSRNSKIGKAAYLAALGLIKVFACGPSGAQLFPQAPCCREFAQPGCKSSTYQARASRLMTKQFGQHLLRHSRCGARARRCFDLTRHMNKDPAFGLRSLVVRDIGPCDDSFVKAYMRAFLVSVCLSISTATVGTITLSVRRPAAVSLVWKLLTGKSPTRSSAMGDKVLLDCPQPRWSSEQSKVQAKRRNR